MRTNPISILKCKKITIRRFSLLVVELNCGFKSVNNVLNSWNFNLPVLLKSCHEQLANLLKRHRLVSLMKQDLTCVIIDCMLFSKFLF